MISVICCTKREEFIDNIFENYLKQRVQRKELIIILNHEKMNIEKWREKSRPYKNISVYEMYNHTLGECLNFGVRLSKYDTFAKLDDDDYYSPNYLKNQIHAMRKWNADIVCKKTVYMYFKDKDKFALHLAYDNRNTFLNQPPWGVKGSTLVIKKSVWQIVKFLDVNISEDFEFLKKCKSHNYKIFITNEHDYICLRRSENNHTWKISNQLLLEHSKAKSKSFGPPKRFIASKNKIAVKAGKMFHHLRTPSKHIALTFDDGPDPRHTPLILDLLKQFGAKATFFVVGKQVAKYPELAQRIVAEGHDIGNHTYHHPNLAQLSPSQIYQELLDTEQLIQRTTGKKTRIFRPPYLSKNNQVLQIVNELGYKTIMCSVDTFDYNPVGVNDIMKTVMSACNKGEIVLLHDSGGDRSQTVKAVGIILENLQHIGYQCVSVSELLDIHKKST
ncbi:polysaccharide deacetylase family protein [Paenibacillus aestuarii]|uniref:Polysaccharide deacetylase family protein n=1 Tax=Paenibacillus aestuarii TaxID=516965 RepID=A0ABW0KAB7_9BACL|nr:polysaccharide deacetylase family protein [Paenibacillus aestuarii]